MRLTRTSLLALAYPARSPTLFPSVIATHTQLPLYYIGNKKGSLQQSIARMWVGEWIDRLQQRCQFAYTNSINYTRPVLVRCCVRTSLLPDGRRNSHCCGRASLQWVTFVYGIEDVDCCVLLRDNHGKWRRKRGMETWNSTKCVFSAVKCWSVMRGLLMIDW